MYTILVSFREGNGSLIPPGLMHCSDVSEGRRMSAAFVCERTSPGTVWRNIEMGVELERGGAHDWMVGGAGAACALMVG